MAKFDHIFIQARDYDVSFHFYTEILGWRVTYSHGSAKDASRLAYIQYHDFKLVLAEDHSTVDPKLKAKTYETKGRISIHFETNNLEESFSRIKPGPHVIRAPEDTHWGNRWFLVEDPDGHQFGWQTPVS